MKCQKLLPLDIEPVPKYDLYLFFFGNFQELSTTMFERYPVMKKGRFYYYGYKYDGKVVPRILFDMLKYLPKEECFYIYRNRVARRILLELLGLRRKSKIWKIAVYSVVLYCNEIRKKLIEVNNRNKNEIMKEIYKRAESVVIFILSNRRIFKGGAVA